MNAFLNNNHVSFFGRSFTELLQCYGLQADDLTGESILDCSAGPSSFAAEANRIGISVTATDPMYYRRPEALENLARTDFEHVFRQVRRKPDLISNRTFETVEAAEADRCKALGLFLEDYREFFAFGRYVAARLPSLPFSDDSFDRVLCAHFLFIYEMDFAFHLASLAELCRIAKIETRIHPIVNGEGDLHPDLPRLMEALAKIGYKSEIIHVDHEFFKGTDRTLIVRKE